tara:strand:+ start:900 stop:1298 length:399 start_codon:yes stop_codon:yes gene_type:complete
MTRYAYLVDRGDGELIIEKCFLFDSMTEDLDKAPANSGAIPWMILEYYGGITDRNKIVVGDAIPEEVERWKCLVEDCEGPHCSRCGQHFDPFAAYGSTTCDACQISDASNFAEEQTALFGGNSEAAAKYHEW